VSFTVDQLATAQTSVSATYRADGSAVVSAADPAAAALDLGVPATVTVVKADSTIVTVQPAGGSLADVARALNEAADSGVRATVVRAGVDDEGVPVYRLQLTGTATGEDGSFEVYAGDGTGGTLLSRTTIGQAQDAAVTLWAGTPAETEFRSATNTFSELMTGVDITVSKVTGPDDEPTTVTVGRDDAALSKLAKDLVGAMGVVLSEISSRTATTTRTNSDGTTTVTGGLFTADSAVRSIRTQLSDALGRPVGTTSPAEVGIVLGRDGTFTFDEQKFAAAVAADPTTVQTIVQGLAQRVSDAATGISDRFDGTLTLKIQNQERQVRDLGTQIESWDRRLELRRAGLQRTYSALEVTLSNLQGQSSWLAGQLSGLMAGSGR
jgi:flagellar hook-associated protein 2